MIKLSSFAGRLMYAAAMGGVFVLSQTGIAAAWVPQEKVEIVVPSGPGGALDQVARNLQRIMTEDKLVDVPVTVVNKPGASMGVGLTYLRDNPGDGNRIAVFATSQISGQITGQNPIDYRELTPISVLFSEYMTTIVSQNSKIKGPRDLVSAVKGAPQEYVFGVSPALGTPNHLALATVITALDIKLSQVKFVVFKSTPESTAALLGGHTHISSAPPSVALRYLRDGSLRPIAVCAPKRLGGSMSDVPTWNESGQPCDIANFRGIGGPAGMKPEQVAFWEDTLAKAIKSEHWTSFLKKRAVESDFHKSAESKAFIDAQFKGLQSALSSVGLSKK